MRLALLLALLLLCSGHARAEDDDDGLEPLHHYGVEDPSGIDDPYGPGPGDSSYDEDDADRDEFIGLNDDASAERMEGMAEDVEGEAEDAGEPRDPLTEDADEPGDDPFADIIKDPYTDPYADDEPEEPPTELDGSMHPPEPADEAEVAPALPPLGSPLKEESPGSEAPLDGPP